MIYWRQLFLTVLAVAVFPKAYTMTVCQTRVDVKRSTFENPEGSSYTTSIHATCPQLKKNGYILSEIIKPEQEISLTYLSEDGRPFETKIKGSKLQEGRKEIKSLTLSDLAENLQRANESQGIMTASTLKSFGIDPQQAGTKGKFYITQVTVPESQEIYRDSDLKALVKSSNANSKNCIYVGSNKKILKTNGMVCGSKTNLCVAAVECLDEKVGWVTRTVSCTTDSSNKCPGDANECLAQQGSIAEIVSADSENSNQPMRRPQPAGGTK